MSTWLLVLLLVAALFVLRGIVFCWWLWRLDALEELMHRYWKHAVERPEVGDRKREIVRLFRVAHLKEAVVDDVNFHIGGWMHRTASTWDNLLVQRTDVQQFLYDAFVEAKGYFRDEIRRSFIPVFWPSVAINVIPDILVYVGVKPEAAALSVMKAVIAVAGVLGTALALWSAFG
jgi:hypothetical protein